MTTLSVPLGPCLTRAQAKEIVALGEKATIVALLQLAKMLDEQQRPPGPSCVPTDHRIHAAVPSGRMRGKT